MQTITRPRHEQAFFNHHTSWKIKQEHRETTRGTLDWHVLSWHWIMLPEKIARSGTNKKFRVWNFFKKIDELDFVVWNRGWQDGWLCGHHKIDLFYKKYNQNTYFIFHHSICLNVSVCPNTDIYVSDIDCMYILFENVSEVDFLMAT